MLLQNIIVCNMEVPHFESGIWWSDDQSLWCIISFQCHFIKWYGGIISIWRHSTSLSYHSPIHQYWFQWKWQWFSIFTNFNLMPFQRIGMISFTNFLHFLCSRSYHLIRCNNPNESKMHRKRPWAFTFIWTRGRNDSTLNVWVDNTHIVAHKEALSISPTL